MSLASSTSPPVLRELLRQRVAGLFTRGAVVLLFLAYPLALIPAGLASLEYAVIVPTVALATLLALPVLVATASWLRGWWRWPVLAYVLGWGVSYALYPAHHLAAIELLGYVVIPLAVALLGREGRLPTWPALGTLGLVLWAVQLGYTLWEVAVGRSVVGITGNPNWLAAALVALTPCALWRLDLWAQARWPGWRARVAAALLVLLPTLYGLARCRSRGAVVAALLMLAVFAWWRLRGLWRGIVLVWLTLIPLAVGLLVFASAPEYVHGLIKADVRLPMWGRTAALVIDHDWTARSGWALLHGRPLATLAEGDLSGVGPGNFQRAFTPYRADSTYHQRRVAAPKTIHPHNELLNIGAQLGLWPMLAWLLLCLPVLRRPAGPGPMVAGLATAALLAAGMFDMPLVQPPTSLLAWLCLGLCWIPLVDEAPAWWHARTFALARRGVLAVVLLAVLTLCLVVTLHEVRRTWLTRAGMICEARGDVSGAWDCYTRANAAAPDDLELTYRRALLAWQAQHDVARALPLILKVYVADPNYIHINELLASVLNSRRLYNQAMPHLIREVELYPYSPEGWQRASTGFIILGDYANALRARQRFEQLLPEVAERYFSPAQLQELSLQWCLAVQRHEADAARELAAKLLTNFNFTYVDPLFLLGAGNRMWPESYLRAPPLEDDAAFWHQAELLARYLAPARTRDPGQALVAALTQLRPLLRIDPQQTGFQYLLHGLRDGHVSPWSAYALGCELGQLAGFRTHVEVDAQGAPVALVCLRAEVVVRCAWDQQPPTTYTPAAWLEHRRQTGSVPFKVYYPLHQMLGRNQVLATLVQRYGPPSASLAPASPALLAAQEVLGETQHPVPFPVLGSVLVRDEFESAHAKFPADDGH